MTPPTSTNPSAGIMPTRPAIALEITSSKPRLSSFITSIQTHVLSPIAATILLKSNPDTSISLAVKIKSQFYPIHPNHKNTAPITE